MKDKENIITFGLIGSSVLILLIMFLFDIAKITGFDFGFDTSFTIWDLENPFIIVIGTIFLIAPTIFIILKKYVLSDNENLKFIAIGALVLTLIGIILICVNLFESASEYAMTIAMKPTFIVYIVLLLSMLQAAFLGYQTFIEKK